MGEVLLRTAGRIGLDDFTKAWQDSVPDGKIVKIFRLQLNISYYYDVIEFFMYKHF